MSASIISRKSAKIFQEGRVKKEIETDRRIHFKVLGDTETYAVTLDKTKNEWTCDCKYWVMKQKECSHISAAKLKA